MKRILIAILLCAFTSNALAEEDCERHRNEAKKWLSKAEDAAKAALVAAGIASCYLPLIGTLAAGAAVGSIAAGFQRKHDICLKRYEDCLRNNNEERVERLKRESEEAWQRHEEEMKKHENKEKKEEQEELNSVEIQEAMKKFYASYYGHPSERIDHSNKDNGVRTIWKR